MKPIPVILDTDIGSDIDDTWALVMLLKSPELDLRLVSACSGDTRYRAGLLAKLLELAGRSDVPVAIGPELHDPSFTVRDQASWLGDYDLAQYPGVVYQDGVQAIIDTIISSPEPVTLIGIGPLNNLAAALQRAPEIAERARFVGMQGSIRLGYAGMPMSVDEYNVRLYPQACAEVFAAPWPVTITPLDTCGLVWLDEDRYNYLLSSRDPLVLALLENYRAWRAARQEAGPETNSSLLFDTVAVYLAFAEDFLQIEPMGIRVTADGYTRVDEQARPIRCATGWSDLEAFKDFLVARLLDK